MTSEGAYLKSVAPDCADGKHIYSMSASLNEAGKMVYTCDGCGATYAEETEPLTAIYVAKTGIDTLPASGSYGSSDAPFASFETAVQYAAAAAKDGADVTITIVDSAFWNGVFRAPEYAGSIRVTGGTLNNLDEGTTAYHRFYMGGDMTFDSIEMVANSTVLAACNHKLVLGEGITTSGSWYILGGTQDGTVNGTLAGDVTVRSGDYDFLIGGNRHDYVDAASGTINLTVGKTNSADTLSIKHLIPFSYYGGTLSATSKAIIRIDGEATITNLYANIIPSTDETLGKTVYTEGVNYDVDVILTGSIGSTVAGNRATDAIGTFNVYNAGVPGASEASAAEATALVEAFDAFENITAVAKTAADYCVDYNGGHYWNDGVVTTAPGVGTVGEKTYTCTCGATKTEEVEALKAALAQKSISAVTDKASGESTMRFIAKLEFAEGVTVKEFGTYIALVALGEDGTPSAEGAKVVVKKQTVTDTAPATFALDLTGIPADQTGTSVYAWSYVDLLDGTRVSFAFDAASVTAVLAAQQ